MLKVVSNGDVDIGKAYSELLLYVLYRLCFGKYTVGKLIRIYNLLFLITG